MRGGVAVMTPDSSEGRERITRLEERVESNRRQIEMLGPLPLQVGLVQRGQDELREDMAQLRRDTQEWQKDFSRQVKSDLIHCSNEIAKVAKSFENSRAEATVDRRDDRTSRRAMWALLGAAAITGILTLAATLVQAIAG
jgi:predicted  nucleic acid-binding Zn-ribbon protein